MQQGLVRLNGALQARAAPRIVAAARPTTTFRRPLPQPRHSSQLLPLPEKTRGSGAAVVVAASAAADAAAAATVTAATPDRAGPSRWAKPLLLAAAALALAAVVPPAAEAAARAAAGDASAAAATATAATIPASKWVAARLIAHGLVPTAMTSLLVAALNHLARRAERLPASAAGGGGATLADVAPAALRGPAIGALVALLGIRLARNLFIDLDAFTHLYRPHYGAAHDIIEPLVRRRLMRESRACARGRERAEGRGGFLPALVWRLLTAGLSPSQQTATTPQHTPFSPPPNAHTRTPKPGALDVRRVRRARRRAAAAIRRGRRALRRVGARRGEERRRRPLAARRARAQPRARRRRDGERGRRGRRGGGRGGGAGARAHGAAAVEVRTPSFGPLSFCAALCPPPPLHLLARHKQPSPSSNVIPIIASFIIHPHTHTPSTRHPPSKHPPCQQSFASWVIAAAGGVVALNVLGVNVLPLLTVGGASTIVVGFASQQLLTNAVNGISIVRERGRGSSSVGGGGP